MRYFFSCVFVVMLMTPALTFLENLAPDEACLIESPGFDLNALKEPDYYQAWHTYLKRKLSCFSTLTRLKKWTDYCFFNIPDNPAVHAGRKGWLFKAESVKDYRKQACDKKNIARKLILELQALTRLNEINGRLFLFCPIPNKSTIYPEFVGGIPKSVNCRYSFYDLLLNESEDHHLPGFLRLDKIFKKAKQNQIQVFEENGPAPAKKGVGIAAQAILEYLYKNHTSIFADDDLKSRLLANTNFSVKNNPGATQGPLSKGFSTALIYGSPDIGQLLPALTHRFDRIDIVMSRTIPSSAHSENPAEYKVVIIAVPEYQLAEIHIDIDRLCKLYGADQHSVRKANIPGSAVSAGKHLSLENKDNQIVIKSLGEKSFFNFPALPGSDKKTLRFVKIPISSPQADTLTWEIKTDKLFQGKRRLQPGDTTIYLPVPQASRARISINPGMQTGLFRLKQSCVLELQAGFTRPGSGENYKPQAMPPVKNLKDSAFELNKRNTSAIAANPDAMLPPKIRLTGFEDGRIFQRHGKSADIVISGTYAGTPVAIEARVLHHSTKELVTDWTVIDNAPDAGVFMGILANVPQGGWYQIAVRFNNQPDIRDISESRWAVGILAACIGQSNMREWFYTGSGLKAHTLLSLHRHNKWQPENLGGNGAIAFGNRLINKLSIPVGLLDYAVNGSGLHKKADWGKGYWTDQSKTGIYNKFIQGVSSAGGAIEYIIWMQGEADAARSILTQNQYRQALMTFISNQIRSDIINGSHLKHLPILIVGMPKRPIGKDPSHQAVRDAQRAASNQIADCFLAAHSLDLSNLGRQHLAPEAYIELGLRTAQAVLYLMNEANYYQGPKIAEACRVSDDKIDITLNHRGGTDFAPDTGISGFEILQEKKSLPIFSVQRHNCRTIRILLKEPAAGSLKVRYLYGAMPGTSRPVRDNSPLELPLEPFQIVIQ
ncbi:MAG: hypothetical protein GY874_07185 [Desulfobacteraceae bacterium]|nr:hypothetical protein [Desulfobacteraceae bacterium]